MVGARRHAVMAESMPAGYVAVAVEFKALAERLPGAVPAPEDT